VCRRPHERRDLRIEIVVAGANPPPEDSPQYCRNCHTSRTGDVVSSTQASPSGIVSKAVLLYRCMPRRILALHDDRGERGPRCRR